MLAGIIALGTIGLWIFLCLFTILFWCLVENEKHGWATVSMVVAFVLFGFLGNFNVLDIARSHPLNFFLIILSYFVSGTVWSVAKWFFHVNKMARKYRDMREEWCIKNYVNPPLTVEQLRMFHNYTGASRYATRPRAKQNKSMILTWMIYWPWSFVWTMINDPVVWFFKKIYRAMINLFDRISSRAYRDIDLTP